MSNKESNLFVSTLQSKPFRHYFFLALIISLLICTLLCIIDFIFGLTPLIFGTGEKEMENAGSIATELIITEVSSAFIIVTLSNIFSSTSQKVYWTDTLRYRLISPKYTNFTALSGYIMATMLSGLLFFIIENIIRANHVISIFASFVLSVILMIILTARMIDSNFGREKVMVELEAKLKELRSEAGVSHHYGIKNEFIIPEVNQLVDVSFQEVRDGEMEYVYENLSLLARTDCMGAFGKIYRYVQAQDSYSIIEDNFKTRLLLQSTIDNTSEKIISAIDRSYDPKAITLSWEEALYQGFDEARTFWKKGDKDNALNRRVSLYRSLTEYLHMKLIQIDLDRSAGKSDKELTGQWARIAYLMLMFMELREDPFNKYFNVPSFGELESESLPDYVEWVVPEWESIPQNDDVRAKRTDLIQAITGTREIWEYNLGIEDNDDGQYGHTLLEQLDLNNY